MFIEKLKYSKNKYIRTLVELKILGVDRQLKQICIYKGTRSKMNWKIKGRDCKECDRCSLLVLLWMIMSHLRLIFELNPLRLSVGIIIQCDNKNSFFVFVVLGYLVHRLLHALLQELLGRCLNLISSYRFWSKLLEGLFHFWYFLSRKFSWFSYRIQFQHLSSLYYILSSTISKFISNFLRSIKYFLRFASPITPFFFYLRKIKLNLYY